MSELSHSQNTASLSLIERLQTRDEAAWQRLTDLYGPLIYHWCWRSGLKSSAAAEVFQDVVAAVLAGIDSFHRDRPGDTFRGWLWTITRNKIRDHAACPGRAG